VPRRFNITNHALTRFQERTGLKNVQGALDNARPCSDIEVMDIITNYIYKTQGPKCTLNNERFFINGNVVFLCLQNEPNVYLVITCWIKEDITDTATVTTKVKVKHKGAIENRLHNAWQSLESPRGTIQKFLTLLNDEVIPGKVRQKIMRIYKNNIGVSKEQFIESITHLKP
jgi:hypothetical protein